MSNPRILQQFSRIINKLASHLVQVNVININKIEIKEDLSPVSNVDLEIEEMVKVLLNDHLPEASLITEESKFEFDLKSKSTFVVLDPIDGTENFISGLPIWGTGLALFYESKLVAGCILFPEMRLIAKTSNIFFDDLNTYRTFRKHTQDSRIKLFSSNSTWENQVNNFGQENRIFGCSLFNLTQAALGNGSYYSSEVGVKLWDIAPALAIALEHGAEVRVNGIEFDGQVLDPYSRFMVEIQVR